VNGEPNQRFMFRRLADLARPIERGPDRDRNGDHDRDGDDWDREHRWERYYGRFDEREHRWGMAGDGVCFYREPGYRGRSFCVRAGEDVRHLPDELADRFRSVKFFGRVRGVQVFAEEEFGGRRLRFESDQPEIRDMRRIISVRVD
jgi:hypothetical protein